MAYLGLHTHFASEPPLELLSLFNVCNLWVEGLAGKLMSPGRSHLVNGAEATAVNESDDFHRSPNRSLWTVHQPSIQGKGSHRPRWG